MFAIQGRDLLPSPVSQRLRRTEVREEVPVSLENVELVGRGGLVVPTEGPRTSRADTVLGCESQCALGDAEVEVAEDELDSALSVSITVFIIE